MSKYLFANYLFGKSLGENDFIPIAHKHWKPILFTITWNETYIYILSFLKGWGGLRLSQGKHVMERSTT